MKATLEHINASSEKLGPLLDDLSKTSAEANKTLEHVDCMIGENREDVRAAVIRVAQIAGHGNRFDRAAGSDAGCKFGKHRRVAGKLPACQPEPQGVYGHDQGKALYLAACSSPREHKTGEPR